MSRLQRRVVWDTDLLARGYPFAKPGFPVVDLHCFLSLSLNLLPTASGFVAWLRRRCLLTNFFSIKTSMLVAAARQVFVLLLV